LSLAPYGRSRLPLEGGILNGELPENSPPLRANGADSDGASPNIDPMLSWMLGLKELGGGPPRNDGCLKLNVPGGPRSDGFGRSLLLF
jgi:hypothetical protein